MIQRYQISLISTRIELMLMNENQDKYLYANYDTKFEEKELGYVYIYNSRGLGDVVDTIALIEDAKNVASLDFIGK